MSLFNKLFAFSARNQSANAKRKPFQLSLKLGDQSIKAKLAGEVTEAEAESLVALAIENGIEVTYSTPVGAAKGSKTFAHDAEPAAQLVASMIGVSIQGIDPIEGVDTSTVPPAIAKRSESLNGAAAH